MARSLILILESEIVEKIKNVYDVITNSRLGCVRFIRQEPPTPQQHYATAAAIKRTTFLVDVLFYWNHTSNFSHQTLKHNRKKSLTHRRTYSNTTQQVTQ